MINQVFMPRETPPSSLQYKSIQNVVKLLMSNENYSKTWRNLSNQNVLELIKKTSHTTLT